MKLVSADSSVAKQWKDSTTLRHPAKTNQKDRLVKAAYTARSQPCSPPQTCTIFLHQKFIFRMPKGNILRGATLSLHRRTVPHSGNSSAKPHSGILVLAMAFYWSQALPLVCTRCVRHFTVWCCWRKVNIIFRKCTSCPSEPRVIAYC